MLLRGDSCDDEEVKLEVFGREPVVDFVDVVFLSGWGAADREDSANWDRTVR